MDYNKKLDKLLIEHGFNSDQRQHIIESIAAQRLGIKGAVASLEQGGSLADVLRVTAGHPTIAGPKKSVYDISNVNIEDLSPIERRQYNALHIALSNGNHNNITVKRLSVGGKTVAVRYTIGDPLNPTEITTRIAGQYGNLGITTLVNETGSQDIVRTFKVYNGVNGTLDLDYNEFMSRAVEDLTRTGKTRDFNGNEITITRGNKRQLKRALREVEDSLGSVIVPSQASIKANAIGQTGGITDVYRAGHTVLSGELTKFDINGKQMSAEEILFSEQNFGKDIQTGSPKTETKAIEDYIKRKEYLANKYGLSIRGVKTEALQKNVFSNVELSKYSPLGTFHNITKRADQAVVGAMLSQKTVNKFGVRSRMIQGYIQSELSQKLMDSFTDEQYQFLHPRTVILTDTEESIARTGVPINELIRGSEGSAIFTKEFTEGLSIIREGKNIPVTIGTSGVAGGAKFSIDAIVNQITDIGGMPYDVLSTDKSSRPQQALHMALSNIIEQAEIQRPGETLEQTHARVKNIYKAFGFSKSKIVTHEGNRFIKGINTNEEDVLQALSPVLTDKGLQFKNIEGIRTATGLSEEEFKQLIGPRDIFIGGVRVGKGYTGNVPLEFKANVRGSSVINLPGIGEGGESPGYYKQFSQKGQKIDPQSILNLEISGHQKIADYFKEKLEALHPGKKQQAIAAFFAPLNAGERGFIPISGMEIFEQGRFKGLHYTPQELSNAFNEIASFSPRSEKEAILQMQKLRSGVTGAVLDIIEHKGVKINTSEGLQLVHGNMAATVTSIPIPATHILGQQISGENQLPSAVRKTARLMSHLPIDAGEEQITRANKTLYGLTEDIHRLSFGKNKAFARARGARLAGSAYVGTINLGEVPGGTTALQQRKSLEILSAAGISPVDLMGSEKNLIEEFGFSEAAAKRAKIHALGLSAGADEGVILASKQFFKGMGKDVWAKLQEHGVVYGLVSTNPAISEHSIIPFKFALDVNAKGVETVRMQGSAQKMLYRDTDGDQLGVFIDSSEKTQARFTQAYGDLSDQKLRQLNARGIFTTKQKIAAQRQKRTIQELESPLQGSLSQIEKHLKTSDLDLAATAAETKALTPSVYTATNKYRQLHQALIKSRSARSLFDISEGDIRVSDAIMTGTTQTAIQKSKKAVNVTKHMRNLVVDKKTLQHISDKLSGDTRKALEQDKIHKVLSSASENELSILNKEGVLQFAEPEKVLESAKEALGFSLNETGLATIPGKGGSYELLTNQKQLNGIDDELIKILQRTEVAKRVSDARMGSEIQRHVTGAGGQTEKALEEFVNQTSVSITEQGPLGELTRNLREISLGKQLQTGKIYSAPARPAAIQAMGEGSGGLNIINKFIKKTSGGKNLAKELTDTKALFLDGILKHEKAIKYGILGTAAILSTAAIANALTGNEIKGRPVSPDIAPPAIRGTTPLPMSLQSAMSINQMPTSGFVGQRTLMARSAIGQLRHDVRITGRTNRDISPQGLTFALSTLAGNNSVVNTHVYDQRIQRSNRDVRRMMRESEKGFYI